MAYSLSFSEEFFSGDGEYDYYEMPASERPTNVLQAIISQPREWMLDVAVDVLGCERRNAEFYVDSESFAADVLDRVREYDTCDDLSSPITVYLDEFYSVTVYE